MKYRFLWLMALLGSAAATAEEAPDCAALEDDRERLECYDRLFQEPAELTPAAPPPPAPGASEPVATREPPDTPATAKPSSEPAAAGASAGVAASTSETQQAAATPTEDMALFGLSGKLKKDYEEQSAAAKAPEEIQATIVKVQKKPYGEHVLTLDNGQIWEQREVVWHIKFAEGDVVTIERGAMGAYFLHYGKKTTKVRRIK